MKAIILAANDNAELRPLNQRKPSALVKINGIPLLEHQIRGYRRAGVETASILILSGYQHSQVKRYLMREHPDIRLVRNPDYRSADAVYSLDLALRRAEPPTADEGLLISSGECMYEDGVIERVSGVSGSAIVVDSSRYGAEATKVMAEDGNVVLIGTHIPKQSATGVAAGLCKLDAYARTVLDDIAAERTAKQRDAPVAVALSDLIRRAPMKLVDIAGTKWTALRTMDDLHTADKRFSRFSLSGKRCFVFDLDGTVYVGNRPIRGTVEFINRNVDDRAFFFVTNNTSRLPEDYRARLNALGIPADAEHILTPLGPLIAYLHECALTHVYLLANARVTAYLREALPGLELTADPEACEALIVAYDTELTYDKLRDAALLLQQNPRLTFLATHGDIVCPTEHGFVPDSGCILSVLEQATGRTPNTVFGKPNPLLLERVTTQYSPSEMVVAGDRLYTDRQMARNVGCDFICVLSGETTRERIDELSEGEFPSLIVKDLGDLLT
ncbi:MAG: HAD-IIA family hydrolase [Halobacteriota archaeon]|jgi:HAD superfamily hydrolase (TIGR01450 family)